MKRLAFLLSLPMTFLAGCDQGARELPFVCGSVAGFTCPAGASCELSGSAADADGSCAAAPDNRCSGSADCPAGYSCQRTVGESAGFCSPRTLCQKSTQCAADELCVDWTAFGEKGWSRLSDGYCVPAAKALGSLACDDSCPVPLTCIEGRCQLECAVSTDCPHGASCIAGGGANGVCLAQQ